MIHYVTLPDLGLGNFPVASSLWLVEVGAEVNGGDRLLELLADSVTVDLPSPVTGILTETLVAEDEVLVVGQKLAVITAPE